MNSTVSSLYVGDRLVSRCDDGLFEAEYSLFDRSEVLLSPGAREEGYMTTAGVARVRLYDRFVTADLAYQAFSALRGRDLRPLARSSAVRDVIGELGPYETFQGGRFVAGRRRYTGVWLDLDALAAECPLPNASVLFQALHLVLVLEELTEGAPVRLSTPQAGSGGATEGRTWRGVDLEPAQRLPRALREMQAPARPHITVHDEAEVREEILRDLHARATSAAIAQPRLRTLAAAIARTGGTLPPAGGQRPPIVLAPEPAPAARQPNIAPLAQPVQVATSTALALRSPRSGPPGDDPFGDGRPLDPRLLLLSEPDSQRSAGFRLLRDNLITRGAPRIIAVSSGSPNEGKTTCAINLALAFSERPSTRVLLLEGNFFAPSLGDIFHVFGPEPQTDLPLIAPYCIARRIRDLHVAALLQRPGEPPPIFKSQWFEMVIGHLSGDSYDFLVIDAAALDGSPAVAQLLGVADGVLLTARSRSTTARSLRRAAERIPPGRALGVTLMDGEA